MLFAVMLAWLFNLGMADHFQAVISVYIDAGKSLKRGLDEMVPADLLDLSKRKRTLAFSSMPGHLQASLAVHVAVLPGNFCRSQVWTSTRCHPAVVAKVQSLQP